MAIARAGKALTFTATNDGLALAVGENVVGVSFEGTGLTLGQRVTLRDSATVGGGTPLADYSVEGTSAYVDLWNGRQKRYVEGLSLSNTTAAGTWVLTVSFE